MKPLLNFFFEIIFPPHCLGCRNKFEGEKKSGLICGKCFKTIEIANGFFCPKCGKRLFDYKSKCHQEEKFVLAAAASYKNLPLRELIHALKYRRLLTALEPLAQILNEYLAKIGLNSVFEQEKLIIVPIPLHPKKERERGFNQTLLIARQLKTSTDALKIENAVLVKTRSASAQMALADYQKRAENVRNSFEIKNKERIAGKNILLLDDVYTSGATMREAVRVLKENGAKKIIGLVIAKA